MNCSEYQEQIALSMYDNEDIDRQSVQDHIQACEDCRLVFEENRQLHAVLGKNEGGWHVPADLLSEARRELSNELDRINRRSWWRLPWLTPMRVLESAALVAVGLAVGVFMQSRPSVPAGTAEGGVPSIANGAISNVRIVEADTVSGRVELAGEVIQPMRFEGQLTDESIRGLLFSALRDAGNPGFRMRAVDLLATNPKGQAVKEALIHALTNDENAGVRLRALQGLKAFANEPDVRVALMHSLEQDSNAGVRVEAIEALTASSRDEQLAKSLEQLVKDEENPYIRMKALQFVGNPR